MTVWPVNCCRRGGARQAGQSRYKKEPVGETDCPIQDPLVSEIGYRRKMPITEVRVFFSSFYGWTGYYVCPRCSVTLEREYMAFCDRCGQKLDWKGHQKAKAVYPEACHSE